MAEEILDESAEAAEISPEREAALRADAEGTLGHLLNAVALQKAEFESAIKDTNAQRAELDSFKKRVSDARAELESVESSRAAALADESRARAEASALASKRSEAEGALRAELAAVESAKAQAAAVKASSDADVASARAQAESARAEAARAQEDASKAREEASKARREAAEKLQAAQDAESERLRLLEECSQASALRDSETKAADAAKLDLATAKYEAIVARKAIKEKEAEVSAREARLITERVQMDADRAAIQKAKQFYNV